MNNRIQQLAEQAFEPINAVATEGVADRHTFDQEWFRLYNQRFAELIVKECVDIAYQEGDNVAYLALHFRVEDDWMQQAQRRAENGEW